MAKRAGRTFAGLAGIGVASWLLARRQEGRACPYNLRFLLSIPRPFVGRARLSETLRARPAERILEIGPGNGHYTPSLAEWVGPEGTVDIFDIQQKFLDLTMRVVSERGHDNVRPARGDARVLPYEHDTFDAVVLIGVLGEIPDPQLVLREIARVLKPGNGRLVVGESIIDPDCVMYGVLRRWATESGLHLQSRHGPAVGYYARLTKLQSSSASV